MKAPVAKRSGWRRAARVLGVLLAIVPVLIGAGLLSLRLEAVQSSIVARANSLLAQSFKGRVVLLRAGRIRLSGVSGIDAQVFDPAGRRVLDLRGLSATLDIPSIAWAALTNRQSPLNIHLSSVVLAHGEVLLVDAGAGAPTLAEAFEPKTAGSPSAAPATVLTIDRVELRHLWVHGAIAGGPPLDVELEQTALKLRADAQKTQLVVEGSELRARGMPARADPSGRLRGSLEIPTATSESLSARVHFEGLAAEVSLVLDASYVDSKLAASLTTDAISPEAISQRIPGLSLRSAARLSATAEGTLPELRGKLDLELGAGDLAGDFELLLEPGFTAKSNLTARNLDLSALNPSAPESSLNLGLRVALRVSEKAVMSGDFDVQSRQSQVSGLPLPAALLSGSFGRDPKMERGHLELHADVAEPGAPTTIDAVVTQGKTSTIEFSGTSQLISPPRLKKLIGVSHVRGELALRGSYELESQVLNARLRADLHDLVRAANRATRLTLSGSVSGRLPRPFVDGRLQLTGAELLGQRVTQGTAFVRGPMSQLAVGGEAVTTLPERRVAWAASVTNERGIRIDRPNVNWQQGKTLLRISAEQLQFSAGRTRLKALHLEGAGKADVSLVYGTNLESLNAQGYDLDLGRLWRLFDANAPLTSGTATVSASYELEAGTPRGWLTLHAQDLSFERVGGASARVDLNFSRGQLNARADVEQKRLGHVNIDVQDVRGLELNALNPARITGKLAIAGELRLKQLSDLAPRGLEWPLGRALGMVKYDLAIERQEASDAVPSLQLHLSTKNLQLAGKRKSTTTLTTRVEATAAAPLAVKGIDLDLDLTHRESGPTELAINLRDAYGRLLSLSAESSVTPHVATVRSDLLRGWQHRPLRVKVAVPPRELDRLPIELRPAGLSGLLSAEFALDGALDAPELKLDARVANLHQSQSDRPGLEVTCRGGYAGQHGTFEARAVSKGSDVAHVDLDFDTALRDWLVRNGTHAPPLEANANLQFSSFPLGLLPAQRVGRLEGALTGKVLLEHFGTNALLDANLDIPALNFAHSELGAFHSRVSVRDGKAVAELRVVAKNGTTTADAHSGVAWGARLLPEVQLPAALNLRARELRLLAFAPFARTFFGEIDGRLSGDLHADFRGGPPELSGHADLKDGIAQVAAIGQRFDRIEARIALEPGKAKLEGLSARATSGQLKLTGEARFAGLALTGADAQLRIEKNQRISLSVAGTALDQSYGEVDLRVRPDPASGSQSLVIDVPQFHAHLPDAGSQDLQDLAPARGIRIGTRPRTGEFVTLPLQPLEEGDPNKNVNPTVIDVNLGNQVWVAQGDGTQVQLTGHTHWVLGDPATMTGKIELKGGKLDVSGKEFEIESGVVTFTGELGDPTVVATARWDAADDEQHRVYADASGSASNLKISLRSEPPLTQDQVLSLIVTGSADGSLGGGSGGGTAATAVGAVGGAATQGLNKALSNVSDLDVSTRIDTSTGTARPEIVIQVSPRVSAQILRALGEPAPGTPPDLTFLTLNFRLLNHWSISALVGDRGESGLDLLWRKRY